MGGFALSHGVPDVPSLPVDTFCGFVWYWCVRNADQDERGKFERRLWQPPKGEVGRGVWSAEAETNSLANLSRALKS